MIYRQPDAMMPQPSMANLPPASHPVNVKILLAGGHEYAFTVASDAALLHQLLAALVDQTQTPDRATLFQIPVPERQQAIVFSSASLVGIITEPPMFVPQPASSIGTAASQSLSANRSPQTIATPLSQSDDRYHIQIEDFLSRASQQLLLNYAITNRNEYAETGPATNNQFYRDYRDSLVIYYPQHTAILLQRLEEVLPQVMQNLGLPAFEVAQIETQLTAHNDGNYYKVHNDNSSEDTSTRQLTYVYYFYREPKAFSGGELAIYGPPMHGGQAQAGAPYELVEPRNNSIVFFPSDYLHEVLPVQCASREFANSRFTVNGWIRRPNSLS